MAKVKENNVDFEKLINAATIPGLNQMAFRLAREIKKEIPLGVPRENSTKQGHLKDTVKVELTRKISAGHYMSVISIGDEEHPYAEVLLEGTQGDVTIEGDPTMHFPESAWPDGKAMLGADGYYHFQKVTINRPPDDYIGRAVDNLGDNIDQDVMDSMNVVFGS